MDRYAPGQTRIPPARRRLHRQREGWFEIPVQAQPGAGQKIIVALGPAKNTLVQCVAGRMTGVLGITITGHHGAAIQPGTQFGFDTWFETAAYIPCVRIAPEQNVYAATNINNGYVRPCGVPHVWSSDCMRRGRSEWVQYKFQREASIRSVELVFNSNLNILRCGYNRVFEELVRDYDLEALTARGTTLLASVTDNFLRFRRHDFPPVTASGLRLLIHGTRGFPYAEVFDMRVYGA